MVLIYHDGTTTQRDFQNRALLRSEEEKGKRNKV